MYSAEDKFTDGVAKDGYFIQTDIIKELLLCLDDASIKESYNAILEKENIKRENDQDYCLEQITPFVRIFFGLLHSLAAIYFQEAAVSPKSDEYQIMIDKLAKLTGRTNGFFNLDVTEYEKTISRGLIPVNPETDNGPFEEGQPVRFLNRKVFLEALEFAYWFATRESYEPVKIKSTGYEDYDLLLKIERYAHDEYLDKVNIYKYMKESCLRNPNSATSSGPEPTPANKKLQIEL